MFKAARLLLTREPIISGNSSSILGFSRNASIFRNFTTSSGSPLSSGNSSNFFADFSIFKGKAALMMHPSTPKFIKKESGVVFLNKSGSMMLRFVPAGGLQKYDWSKKQVFALSPTEVGCLISLGPGESCEFVHDPSMKSSLEGQVKKILSVKPISSEDAGYFINLTVNNAILKTSDRFSVPVSKAEFAVMRSAFSDGDIRVRTTTIVGAATGDVAANRSADQGGSRGHAEMMLECALDSLQVVARPNIGSGHVCLAVYNGLGSGCCTTVRDFRVVFTEQKHHAAQSRCRMEQVIETSATHLFFDRMSKAGSKQLHGFLPVHTP